MLVKVFRVALLGAALFLAACQSSNLADNSTFGDSAASIEDVSDVSYYKNDELIRQGVVQFREKNYGKSYAVFKKAVEVFPHDPQAWLGYAAASDHVGRFNNSDKAYAKLGKMIPGRIELYNNLGYSHLLRGDLRKARLYFLKAYEIDPANIITANNLQLLRNSGSFAKRSSI